MYRNDPWKQNSVRLDYFVTTAHWIVAWGIKKPQNSLRPRKSYFPKLVRFYRMIYHSTRLGERFSNLFSDLKNLYAFRSYDWITDFIVTANILNSNGQLWNQYFDHNFWTRKDFLDLKTDLKSARRDASNGISYEGIGPTLEILIFEIVEIFKLFVPGIKIESELGTKHQVSRQFRFQGLFVYMLRKASDA